MGTRICPQCGTEVPAHANFCPGCGTALEREDLDATEAHPIIVVPDPDDVALLVMTKGPSAGSRYVLHNGVTSIGRHPDSGVFLDDVTVSRRHAEIEHHDGTYRIVDRDSLNGTYVNGALVDAHLLTEGDQILIGKFRLLFVMGVPGGDL